MSTNPLTPAKTSDKPLTLRQSLASDYFKQQVALSLPKHMTPDRFIRVGLTALMKTPKLLDCTQESVLQCMLNCSALGLEPDGRRAHLIPYGTTCTLIVDYKGIVELAKRSGDVSNVFAQIVCKNDSFSWENGEVKHQIDFKSARGDMYAAYAIITFKDGTKQTDVMTKDEVDAIRKRSKAANSGPWVTDYNEMAKKTVFRRVSKWITLSPEVADVFEKDDGTQLALPSKPEHAFVDIAASVESSPETKSDDGDLGPEKKSDPRRDAGGNVDRPETPNPQPEPGKVVELKQPEPATQPAQTTAPATPEDAECAKLIGMIQAKMTRDTVTEQSVIAFCKKQKWCSKNAEGLSDMVPAKLILVVENWEPRPVEGREGWVGIPAKIKVS